MSKPIAIIGSACRFPGGADSPSKLWELLRNPKDVLSEFPPERLKLKNFYHKNGEHHGSTDVQNKGYLLSEDIRQFDASFFRINPAEADGMDPQQRILLETVYEALESAGCPLEQMRESLTSVYAGLMNGDFADIQARDLETIQTHHGTGTHRSILSNRISYFLDIKGASMTIDTACSSSLVALHQAMMSLRLGESDMAIVSGANLILDPTMYVAESKLHMLSPDSRSRMWDASANGYARGEGFAAIVLKPLDIAVRDGDDIECVVRGSAVNSDGRTAGITVPSATAQTKLIRQAYQDAGLDPLVDRCQFFEAHGTGTRAGDPVEARAIRDAFFPDELKGIAPDDKLLVGSIKTVVGHLEGCAGLAGVLKVSLAMRNRTIPPNLHFSTLNPAIVPFYDRLHIPTKASDWPRVPAGSPLRASVNSFGFGGTNAHVVLETFQKEPSIDERNGSHSDDERFVGPLILSAHSKDSLVQAVKAHADCIRSNDDLDLDSMTWTLQFRRTHFSNNRAFFSGATRQKLVAYMDAFVEENSAASAAPGDSHPLGPLNDGSIGILGIFTGQGAQWPTMGRNLILQSPLFRKSITQLQASLAALGDDAPSWSLEKELLAEGDRSRVAEAEISQPLCTAVQIGLVDLLRASNVALRSVVGHSSGEIAAVYAAGIISAHDAIRIAYYRGFHAGLAQGPNGKRGAMMAVALSFESASDLCEKPEFAGRVNVAAANSPNSVTLSGDIDAIEALKVYFDTEKIFARKLNVDTAYHSHHMNAAAAAYLASLEACSIQVHPPNEDCIWVSSVRGDAELVLDYADDETTLDVLKDQYWVDNLLNPVLFEPAVECALWRAGPFDIVTEVGPHPALKGPSTQIFKALLGSSLPYFSVMRRGDDEVEAFSGGLGYLWQHFGPAGLIDFNGYRNAFADPRSQKRTPRLLKDLPSYRWDHNRVYWKESRISSTFRLGDRPVHELLGRRAIDDTPELLRWRNILRPAEFPWVRDHVVQGQTVLPGASYVAAVIEASKTLVGEQPIKLVELLDLKIPRAIVLQENKSTELITSLRLVNKTESFLLAEFAFSTAPADDASATIEKTCSGLVKIQLGQVDPKQSLLAIRDQLPPNLNQLDLDLFYTNLKGLGIDYRGSFRATKSAHRTVGYASSLASWDATELGESYSLHPAILDVGFHALLAAFAAPSTGQMWAMYLPVRIRRLTIDLASLRCNAPTIRTKTSAWVTNSSAKGMEGDLQIVFDSCVGVQVEGIELQATGDAMANGDRLLFSNVRWDTDISSGMDNVILEKEPDLIADAELVEAMGRTALYYYRQLLDEISPREMKTLAWHQQMFWQSAQHWVEEVSAGRHPTVKKEWMNDTREIVWKQAEDCQNSIDIVIMRALGEVLPSIARGETQPLEVMMENNMLSRFYAEAHGLPPMNDYIARAVGQIVHRYPKANILEIGAGVGGTTRKVLPAIGNAFGHYTFTDISSGFFEKGAEKFAAHRRKMTFKVCDIEKDPIEQGFVEEGYDIIVAANVLHATRSLADTMRNVRRLLKPGGYLVMMEITGDLMRLGFIMGPLPGWWLGPQIGDEGRQWSPGISLVQWDDLLQRTGFSGVNQVVSDDAVPHKHYVSTIISQAVDKEFDVLRNPLSDLSLVPPLPHDLLILGGESLPVAQLARNLKKTFTLWNTTVKIVASLDMLSVEANERMSVISLTELDKPLFTDELTAGRLERLQTLLRSSDSILWATAGARCSNPTSNMFVGLARALRTERPDINVQLLDFTRLADAAPDLLAEYFLRLALVKQSTYRDKTMVWTTEAELAFDGEKLLISRLLPDNSRNERYNASRRSFNKVVTLQESEVEVNTEGGLVSLLGVDSNLARRLARPRIEAEEILNVDLSVAFSNSTQKYFLSYGSIKSKSKKAFAISQHNRSVLLVRSQNTLLLDSIPPREVEIVEAVAGQLLARNLASSIPRRGDVLVYEPPSESLVRAIESSSWWKGRRVHVATSRTDIPIPASWIFIDPHALASSIKQLIPNSVTAVVDLSTPGCRDVADFAPATAVIRRSESAFFGADKDDLASAYNDALVTLANMRESETKTLPIRTLSECRSSTIIYPSVVDWRQQPRETLSVQVKPLDPVGIFSSSKTHLMVGLNGELGQSICGFMVRNGARHIAISSRRGEVNPGWLETIRREYDADIRLYKMDVTNRQSIISTLDQIEKEMPRIGGVANGALVLQDRDVLNMDIDSLNNTLKPKVDGSKYLDELFPHQNLDYFVCFSSVAAVGNNRSQGNYHAANLFMASLVANRRARGLAGSVIHVGVVIDAGYVARQGRKLAEDLRKQGFMPVSETDAHFLFAEGVIASPADSELHADICMGLEPFMDSADVPLRPPWYGDARLSHFVVQPEQDLADSKQGTGDMLYLRQRLDGATSVQETNSLLQEALLSKLGAMMQLDAGSINVHVPLLDLGFDSLLAVELRTWFLKEVHVDVPVLRLLGGDTTSEICEETAAQYLAFKSEQAHRTEGVLAKSSQPDNDNITSKEDSFLREPSRPTSESSEPPSNTLTSSSLDGHNTSGLPSPPTTTLPTPNNERLAVSDTESAQSKGEPILGTQAQKRMERSTSRVEIMSYAQSRLWFLGQYLDDPITCNIAVRYIVNGPLDVSRFREALNTAIAHHPSLRTCFYADDETGEPTQGLLRTPLPASGLKYLHASHEKDIEYEFDLLRSREWNIAYGDTFGATLLSTRRKDEHIVIFGYHHIVIDGVSWYTILRDLERAYMAQPLSRQRKLYMDFSLDQRQAVESGAMDKAIAFWETVHANLPGALPLLPIASVRRRRPLRRYESHTVTTDIGSDLVARIKEASKALRVTPFNFYLAAMQVFFSKNLNIEDLCIGITDASRSYDELTDVVGFFLNMLPLRFKVGQRDSFADLVQRTSRHVLEGQANGHVPIDVILNRLNVGRDVSSHPLFQVTFNYRVGAMAESSLGKDCHLSVQDIRDAQSPFDIGFGIYESVEGSCNLQVVAQSYLYTRDAAELIKNAYVHLLDVLSSNPLRTLHEYSSFEPSAVENGLLVGKGPRQTWDWPDTLWRRVDDMVTKHTQDTAVIEPRGKLSYGELRSRIHLAASIIQKEVPREGLRIAVLCEPSADLIVSMLAILRLNHVYVPLDTNLPKERHAAILADCEPAILLCHQDTLESALSLGTNIPILNISAASTQKLGTEANPPEHSSDPFRPAFLFYTSGSTGKPKGIQLNQSGFLNHLALKASELSLERETILQQSSFGFDMSLTQSFCALANGGTLVIAAKTLRGDPVALSKLMLEHDVTFTIATPSEYAMLLRYGKSWLRQCTKWKHACMGGEKVTQLLLREFFELGNPNLQLRNCYGPTETSLAVTFDEIYSSTVGEIMDHSSVGRVLPNYSVYILDETSADPVPLGYPGEICIGGVGVAMGYLNLPNLSGAKFTHDPFADAEDVARGWTRMFKTGDRGRLQTDGSLIFMGRMENDSMVKMRGLRVDLDDVANTIVQTAADIVSEAAVALRGEDEGQILVAHVVPYLGQAETLTVAELQKLAQSLPLPAYMRPSLIVPVGHLPRTLNELYQASTLGRMAAHLHRVKEQEPVDKIDWEKETEYQTSSLDLHSTPSACFRECNREILLTGAHTFLGAEILQSLAGDSSVKRVHCVALPKISSNILPRSSKIASYPGSLQSESLGLSSDDISFLQSRIDLIIHAGSVGHCLNNYSSVRAPNLGSLRFLVDFALPRRIPIHFISSNRVVLLSGQYTLPPVSLHQHQPPLDGAEGYTASKWAGERMLEKVAQTTGLAVTIHRPCAVFGPNAPSEDALSALLRFIVSLNAVPRFKNLVGFLDFAPVADVAVSIAQLALNRDHSGGTGKRVVNAALVGKPPVNIVHHSSGVKTPIAGLRSRIETLYGSDFDELDITAWIAQAVKGGMDPLISTYLEAIVEKDKTLRFAYLGEEF
ncbi:hypothetical protein UREG_06499 [Uncinocarpus reesii 1704]|uniref:Uncharacterized protein n=1 Tax=Uncinocarpus reesii (strain UAMH 1704) TaxID=336963 RepID=C4JVA7_UNCRE|nr:uncharacterized protein UREG_06499 [Uncinocarpus reesii 1704]EEP81634.1 hypothetical protein UREG_06499 [Uncinocarpus reesii 1704]